MKKTLSILIFCVLMTIKLNAQEPLRDIPFFIEASRDTTEIIQLNKLDCLETTNFHPGFLSIAQQAPYFYVSVNYFSNCGTVDRMKVEIISDTIYLIQADSGSLMTCACEYGYSIIFQNYHQDSCIVVFGDTSAVYHNPATFLNSSIQNTRKVLIKNPFDETLQIEIISNSNTNESYSMELYGIEGRLLRTEYLNTLNTIIDTRDLNKGIYLVAIKKNGILIMSEKLIKM